MAYAQIEISEVGPAEYPLIEVLRNTIFGQYNHRFSATFAEIVEGRRDVLALIAHLEGNPVGYKVGYHYAPRRYHSWTGGVLPDYRRSGIARRMQDWQHGWCRARGYKFIQFYTFAKFAEMQLFGLSSGFLPTGVEYRPEQELSIKFEKDLTVPDPPRPSKSPPLENVRIESVGPKQYGLIARLCTESLEPRSPQDIGREMDGPHPLALVAFVNDEPVGFKVGRGRDACGHLFESRLGGVLAAYRNRGIGAALARRQITEASAFGYAALRVHTSHQNCGMIALCLKEGFKVTGMLHHQHRKLLVVLLERALNPPPRP